MNTAPRTHVSSLAAFFAAASCATAAFASLFQFAAAGIWKGAEVLHIAAAPPVPELVQTLLRLQSQACTAGLIFFGLFLIGVWRRFA